MSEQDYVDTIDNNDNNSNDNHNDDEYEKVCFVCHRPESVAGKMINLPNNMCVCNDCMQKSFDAMNNMNFGGAIDYSQLMNMPGVQFLNIDDMSQQIPKQQRVKKKKEGEEDTALRLSEMLQAQAGAGVVSGKNTAAQEVPESQNINRKREKAGKAVDKPSSNRKRCGKENHPSQSDADILEEFLQDIAPAAGYTFADMDIHNGQVYYIQNRVPAGRGIPFLRNGLYFGELRKGRFEPSQSLAMALRASDYASVLDFPQADERVRRYLGGETIDVEDLPCERKKGWQLVCVDGYPLGWGKLVNGTLKNKYHPGWRMTV